MSDDDKLEILKMRDTAEGHRVHKDKAFDLPMRLLIIGKSQLSGKTNTVGNLMLRPFDDTDKSGREFYKNDFKGDNIYIVCPSTLIDHKWASIVKGKRIPPENIMMKYDEEELTKLYERLEEEYHEKVDAGEKPEHKLVIFDDVTHSGDLKAKLHGVMARFACNSRHILVSVMVTAQKYSDVSTSLRENATGLMLYACSNKQGDLIYNDIGESCKADFMRMFRRATEKRHSFLVCNYSNDHDHRFMDSNFQKID